LPTAEESTIGKEPSLPMAKSSQRQKLQPTAKHFFADGRAIGENKPSANNIFAVGRAIGIDTPTATIART
jgi:hypothetical protein